MSDDKHHPNAGWWIAGTLTILLSVYVGGYFLASDYERIIPPGGGAPINGRRFASDALVWVYVPMGIAERRLRGEQVVFVSGEYVWFAL